MRTSILPLLALLIACENEPMSPEGKPASSTVPVIDGTWKVVSFENYSDNTIVYPDHANSMGNDIIVTFDADAEPHRLSGRNTTNMIFGDFRYVDEDRIVIWSFATTKIAQPPIADEFNWAVSSGEMRFEATLNRLRLFYQENSRSITLERQ